MLRNLYGCQAAKNTKNVISILNQSFVLNKCLFRNNHLISSQCNVWCSSALCSTRQPKLIPIGISEKKKVCLVVYLLSSAQYYLDIAKKFYFQSIFFNAITQRRQRITYCSIHCLLPLPNIDRIMLHLIASRRKTSHCIALHCIALHCIALHRIALHCMRHNAL